MESDSSDRRRMSGEGTRKKYIFRLFVAGEEVNSKLARENLFSLCQNYLSGHYEIEIIDVFKDFRTALESGVLVTPMLIDVSRSPEIKILGNLSDTEKVLKALGLKGEAGGSEEADI